MLGPMSERKNSRLWKIANEKTKVTYVFVRQMRAFCVLRIFKLLVNTGLDNNLLYVDLYVEIY